MKLKFMKNMEKKQGNVIGRKNTQAIINNPTEIKIFKMKKSASVYFQI